MRLRTLNYIYAWRVYSATLLALALGLLGVVVVVRTPAPSMRGLSRDSATLIRTSDAAGTYAVVIETDAITELVAHKHDPHHDAITDGGHGVWTSSEVVSIEDDVWITSLSVRVNNADPAVLHHAPLTILRGPGATKTRCGNDREFFIFANDNVRSPLSLPAPYAFLLEKGTVLRLDAMLHNPLPPYGPGVPYRDVSITVMLEGVRVRDSATPYKRLLVERLILSDTPCTASGDRTFVVPPQSPEFIKRGDSTDVSDASHYTFVTEAELVMLSGHIHAWDGGERLDVAVGDELLATVIPQRATDDAWSWQAPRLHLGKRMHAGDTVSISARYRNDSPRPITGAMGIVGLYFSPLAD